MKVLVNIIDGVMIKDGEARFSGQTFPCLDKGFAPKEPVDIVIRPEDVEINEVGKGIVNGVVKNILYKGANYEMTVEAGGFDWLIHNTVAYPVGSMVSLYVKPFNIQIMKQMDESEMILDEDMENETYE